MSYLHGRFLNLRPSAAFGVAASEAAGEGFGPGDQALHIGARSNSDLRICPIPTSSRIPATATFSPSAPTAGSSRRP